MTSRRLFLMENGAVFADFADRSRLICVKADEWEWETGSIVTYKSSIWKKMPHTRIASCWVAVDRLDAGYGLYCPRGWFDVLARRMMPLRGLQCLGPTQIVVSDPQFPLDHLDNAR